MVFVVLQLVGLVCFASQRAVGGLCVVLSPVAQGLVAPTLGARLRASGRRALFAMATSDSLAHRSLKNRKYNLKIHIQLVRLQNNYFVKYKIISVKNCQGL